jgi:antitoxin component YwqK of YwqJK toxin-antitoxin module
MNFRIKTLLNVVFLILVYSCSKSRDEISYIDGKLVLKTFYTSGKLKEVSFLSLDSIRNGISVQYYENGDTAVISRYLKGLKDSVETEFYITGELKGLRSWFKNQLWNEYIEYYDGLKDVYFTEMDGDTVKVVEPLVKSYSVYSYTGDIKYQRKFDKKGILISESGNAILIV